jgi:hypothetical protein
MKILQHTIEVTARLELTAREVELLENVTSYGNEKWAAIIADPVHGNSYNGGVSNKEIIAFLDKLRDAASGMKTQINNTVKQGIIR